MTANLESDQAPAPSAIAILEGIVDTNLLTTDLIQDAINEFDPESPEAMADAEVLRSIAMVGAETHPEDQDWWEKFERTNKILNRQIDRSKR